MDQTGTYLTTTPYILSDEPSDNTTIEATYTAPDPTIDPMVVLSVSLKEFNLAFLLFTTTLSQLEVVKDHLQEYYSKYKATAIAQRKLILAAHTTRSQDVMDLLQYPHYPHAPYQIISIGPGH